MPQDKNRLLMEREASSVKECIVMYKIHNLQHTLSDLSRYRPVSICQAHKSKRDDRGAFYAIHTRQLGPKTVNMTASEAKSVIQTPTYNGEKNQHFKYHIFLKNLVKYGYQTYDLGMKVHHLLNSIICYKFSTVITAVRTHPNMRRILM